MGCRSAALQDQPPSSVKTRLPENRDHLIFSDQLVTTVCASVSDRPDDDGTFLPSNPPALFTCRSPCRFRFLWKCQCRGGARQRSEFTDHNFRRSRIGWLRQPTVPTAKCMNKHNNPTSGFSLSPSARIEAAARHMACYGFFVCSLRGPWSCRPAAFARMRLVLNLPDAFAWAADSHF
jgi:hypothetical protein